MKAISHTDCGSCVCDRFTRWPTVGTARRLAGFGLRKTSRCVTFVFASALKTRPFTMPPGTASEPAALKMNGATPGGTSASSGFPNDASASSDRPREFVFRMSTTHGMPSRSWTTAIVPLMIPVPDADTDRQTFT